MAIRSKEDWLGLFKKHEASGLSAVQFCRDENLCTRYFSKRKGQLNWGGEKVDPKSIKIKTTPHNDFVKVSVSGPNTYCSLEYGDLKLHWEQCPSVQWLSDLLKSLR